MSTFAASHHALPPRPMSSRWLVVVALGAGMAAGCSDQKAAAASPAASSPAPAADRAFPEVLATVGSEKITMADVRARAGDELDQNEHRYQLTKHKLVENTVRDILSDRVLMAEAKKQGKTVDQLLEAQIGGPLEPSEDEISAWYNENQARVGGR